MNNEPKLIPVPPKPKPDPGQTYYGRSMAGLDGDGPVGASDVYVWGSGGVPPLPPSVWEADRNNIEPPLGESVLAFEPVGTPREVAASLPPAAQSVECPYFTDEGCVLERNEIGPCLCNGAIK